MNSETELEKEGGQNPSTSSEEAANQENASSVDSVFASDVDPVVKLEAELKEAKERELRSQAELENFRKRMLRDVEQQLRFANLPFARDLLDVVDNLNRATSSAEASHADDPLFQGVKLVQQQLMQVFAKYHCKPIEALGKPFDPNFHQAIAQSPSDEHEAGIIMVEASVGYTIHDRVIRPSQVIVSTGASKS